MSTISKENYLKAIFNYNSVEKENATTTRIAQDLSVSNAAISDMAKKLSSEGLIIYEKYKGMELTDKGEKLALNVVRRHRLWELFLMNVLGLAWSEVHDEAENLEHHTSEFLIDKIDEFLGCPEFDPHGHPIPNKNGIVPQGKKAIPMLECEIGFKYKFIRVDDRDSTLIDYLTKVGLLLNTEFEVVDKLSFDQSVTIQFNGKTHSLSKKISKSVFVNPVKERR